MLGRRSYLQDCKFKVGRYMANQYDLDMEADYLKPGNSPLHKAYLLSSQHGLDLLLRYVESDQFPSFDGLSRRSGAKLMKTQLLFSGITHGPFLSQAMAALMAKTEGRLRFDEPKPGGALRDPAYHENIRTTIQDFFRIPPEARELLDEGGPAEFKVLETGEPRKEVQEGKEAGTAYSAALLRGKNPNDDPVMVREQWEYARDYFIWNCENAAVRSGMERPHRSRRVIFEEIVKDLIDFTTPESGGPERDPKRLTYRTQALERWEGPLRSYLAYAALDAATPGEATAPAEHG